MIMKNACVARNSDGRLDLFCIGDDKALWHIVQNKPDPEPSWGKWESLGGGIAGNPAVFANADGRLEVFARGTDDKLQHIGQLKAGGPWAQLQPLRGTIPGDPAAFANAHDGHLELFFRGADEALWHIWQKVASKGPWSDLESLKGRVAGNPAVARNSDGRLEVFARGADDKLWHTWQRHASAGPWSNLDSLGGIITSDPAVVLNADGHLVVFARGKDNALWHIWQTKEHKNPWSEWKSLGGTITSNPAVALNSEGRLEVFACGAGNVLFHSSQEKKSLGSPWSPWASFKDGGGFISDPAVIAGAEGRLEVFGRGANNALWHISQENAAAGTWSAWTSLGAPDQNEQSFEISAPFAVGDLVAEVTLEDGQIKNEVLRGGKFKGTFQARAVHLRLLLPTQSVLDGGAPLEPTNAEKPGTPSGECVDITQMFDSGIDIPADGKLAVQLMWGAPCHGERGIEPVLDRFASHEHVLAAKLVGLDKDKMPLKCDGLDVSFDQDTLLSLGNGKALKFGEIIALAGDFYAYFDREAAHEFDDAWPTLPGFLGWTGDSYKEPTLVDDEDRARKKLVQIVYRPLDGAKLWWEIWKAAHFDGVRRFAALALANHCHFGMQSWDGTIDDASNEALRLYQRYHERAMAMVWPAGAGQSSTERKAVLLQALAIDAFGCHFLTDLFASGHIRTPRKALNDQLDILLGGAASCKMHEEDNKRGLWCEERGRKGSGKRVVWHAYGDHKIDADKEKMHLNQVCEAVRRSAEEVFVTFCGKPLPTENAVALLPVALRAGTGPVAGDVLPDGTAAPVGEVNHYPMWAKNPNDGPEKGLIGYRQDDTRTYKILKSGRTFELPPG
jgi:hypothetical protein